MSDMRDALNRLSQRGTPRGFDEVLAGAADSAGAGTDAREPERYDLDTIPFVSTEPIEGRRARRPLGSAIAAAGVAALVLVGAFAVSAVVGSGGASSPETAVRQLADAVSHEDPLSAADVLVPDEVRSLHGTIDAAAKKAAELQLVNTASAPLAGVDFNVSGLNLSTESLGDGVAKVTIDAGDFTASTHKKQFSALMQKVLRDTDDNSSESDLAKLASDQNLPTFVMAVRRDGRWYVSAAYTVLEYVREGNHLPAADFGSGERAISTLGSGSPDAAVQDAMHAIAGEDWSKLMALVSPDELPVYDYRAALTELARQNRDDSSGGSSATFTIDSMTTDSQVSGKTAKVTLRASGTTDNGKWSIDGGCFTSVDDTEGSVSFPCGDEATRGLRILPFEGLDKSSQITAVKQDGRWFVSPVGTVLDALDHLISQIDRRALFTFLNIPNQLPPDGRLMLGQAVVLRPDTSRSVQVLTYDGHKGERLLGLATAKSTATKTSPDSFVSAYARVFAPDGSELDEAGGMLEGQALTLPVDGTYTVVLESYDFRSGDISVTIWDEADAPAAAKQPSFGDGTSSCTYTIGGSECMSSSSGTTVAGTNGQLGVGDANAPCKSLQSMIGPNREILGADGKPTMGPDGTPVTLPAGINLTDLCANGGENGGGPFSSSDTAVAAPTIAVTATTAPHG